MLQAVVSAYRTRPCNIDTSAAEDFDRAKTVCARARNPITLSFEPLQLLACQAGPTCGVQGLYEDRRRAEGSPAELVPRLPLAAPVTPAASPVDVEYIGSDTSVLPAGPVLPVTPAAVAAAAPCVGDWMRTGRALVLLSPDAAMVYVDADLMPAAAAAACAGAPPTDSRVLLGSGCDMQQLAYARPAVPAPWLPVCAHPTPAAGTGDTALQLMAVLQGCLSRLTKMI